jgi:hypothetical protein
VLTTSAGLSGVAIPSGSTIGVLQSDSKQISIVDLSGATPVVTPPQPIPIASLTAYAAESATVWVAANMNGVILDGTSLSGQPRYLTPGEAWSIAGGTAYVSVSTASGGIYTFDTSTHAAAGTINFSSPLLSASADGTLLAAVGGDIPLAADGTLNIYSLPSGNLLHSFPSAPPQIVTSLSLSGSGTAVAQTFLNSTTPCLGGEVIAVDTGTQLWCGSGNVLRLSPDGSLLAATSGTLGNYSTSIYRNGTLVGAAPGRAVGWVDNGRLLVNGYVQQKYSEQYTGTSLYDPRGTLLTASPLPELQAIQSVDADTVYSAGQNAMYSISQGQPTWVSANAASGVGAVAGPEVVFAAGRLVLAQISPAGAGVAPTGAAALLSHRHQ